jgi:hypothetical protein
MLNIDCSDGKEAKGVMEQVERSSFNLTNADYGVLRAGEHPQMALPGGSVN